MRILVIDDSPIHQASARQTLVGHDLTIVGTYDEAHRLLEEPFAPWQEVKAELDRLGFNQDLFDDMTKEKHQAYERAQRRIYRELRPSPSFDAVLSDLLMPASSMAMGSKGMAFVGQQVPAGFALSLMAVIHGAKYVAIVTDTSHHDHPASAMIDSFFSHCPDEETISLGSWGEPPRFKMNEATVGYYRSPITLVTCPECKGASHNCTFCDSSGKQWGKDWGRVITHLTAQFE